MSLTNFTWTEGTDIFERSGNLSNYEPVDTLAGDDTISIRGTSATYFGLINSSSIEMGGGDDTLQIVTSSIETRGTGLNTGNISLGIGNDKIIIQGNWEEGLYQYDLDMTSTIDLGEGNDQIYAEGYGNNAFRFLYGEILGGDGVDKVTTKCLSNEEYLQALYLNNSIINLAAHNDKIEVINGSISLIDSTIFMGSGSDAIRCEGAIYGFNSLIDLGEGNDLIVAKSIAGIADSSINGGAGFDTVETSSSCSLGVNFERLILTGYSAINGTGNTFNNIITGNSGGNILNGGVGKDSLTGSTGVDKFIYKSIVDSGVGSAARDVITDFRGSLGEKIDLSAIDAYAPAKGNQAFAYIGSSAFTGTKGEARFSGGVLQMNTGTDKIADMEIALSGVTAFISTFLVL